MKSLSRSLPQEVLRNLLPQDSSEIMKFLKLTPEVEKDEFARAFELGMSEQRLHYFKLGYEGTEDWDDHIFQAVDQYLANRK